jgi:hypothetical protein
VLLVVVGALGGATTAGACTLTCDGGVVTEVVVSLVVFVVPQAAKAITAVRLNAPIAKR